MTLLKEGDWVKLGISLTVVSLLCGGFYWLGVSNTKNTVTERVVKSIEVQYKAGPKEIVYVDKWKTRIKTVHDEVIKELWKTVPQDNPSCDIGPDVIGLLNSNRSVLPTQ